MFDPKDWLLIVIIGLLLVSIGALLDFLILKHELRRIHKLIFSWSNALRNNTITQWQISISNFFIKTVHKIYELPINVLSFLSWYFDQIHFALRGSNTWKAHLIFFSMSICSLLIIFGVPSAYLITKQWFLGSLSVPFLIFLIVSIIQIIRLRKKSILEQHRKLTDPSNVIIGSAFVSSIISLAALFVSSFFIPITFLDSFWFSKANDAISPSFPFLISLINYPFDLLTLLISVWLLGYVVKKGKNIGLIAAVDVVCSAFLSFSLYLAMQLAENSFNILNSIHYAWKSFGWFVAVFIYFFDWLIHSDFLMGPNHIKDIHLIPIVFSTFIPVTLYMLFFIFLSFCKFILLIVSRVFRAISEKNESLFKQFATLIGVWMALFKALFDYLTFP